MDVLLEFVNQLWSCRSKVPTSLWLHPTMQEGQRRFHIGPIMEKVLFQLVDYMVEMAYITWWRRTTWRESRIRDSHEWCFDRMDSRGSRRRNYPSGRCIQLHALSCGGHCWTPSSKWPDACRRRGDFGSSFPEWPSASSCEPTSTERTGFPIGIGSPKIPYKRSLWGHHVQSWGGDRPTSWTSS